MIKAIIFDMDGVLIDAKEWHYLALNKALKIFGFEINKYDHISTFDGLPTKKKLEMLTTDKGLPLNLHRIISDLKQKYTVDLININCKPVFKHEYALARLKNEGYKVVVASNSIKSTIELMMKKSNLYNYLDFYLSNEDVANPKPNPEIYNKAISTLNLKPNECIIFEDNQNGIIAAKESQANLVIVKDTNDISYENIKQHILEIEGGKK